MPSSNNNGYQHPQMIHPRKLGPVNFVSLPQNNDDPASEKKLPPPAGHYAKLVYPVRVTPVTRPPVKAVTRRRVKAVTPKPLKLDTWGEQKKLPDNWREETKRELDMCDYYDELLPVQQVAFRQMMERMGEPLPLPILNSLPACSEAQLAEPRSPLMVPARLLRSYDKKMRETILVDDVAPSVPGGPPVLDPLPLDDPLIFHDYFSRQNIYSESEYRERDVKEDVVVSEKEDLLQNPANQPQEADSEPYTYHDYDRPGLNTAEPLFRERVKEEVVEEEMPRNLSNHLQNPVNDQQDPSTHTQNPSNHLQNPVNYIHNPSSYLQNPSNDLQNPSNHLQNPVNELQNRSNDPQNPSNHLQSHSHTKFSSFSPIQRRILSPTSVYSMAKVIPNPSIYVQNGRVQYRNRNPSVTRQGKPNPYSYPYPNPNHLLKNREAGLYSIATASGDRLLHYHDSVEENQKYQRITAGYLDRLTPPRRLEVDLWDEMRERPDPRTRRGGVLLRRVKFEEEDLKRSYRASRPEASEDATIEGIPPKLRLTAAGGGPTTVPQSMFPEFWTGKEGVCVVKAPNTRICSSPEPAEDSLGSLLFAQPYGLNFPDDALLKCESDEVPSNNDALLKCESDEMPLSIKALLKCEPDEVPPTNDALLKCDSDEVPSTNDALLKCESEEVPPTNDALLQCEPVEVPSSTRNSGTTSLNVAPPLGECVVKEEIPDEVDEMDHLNDNTVVARSSSESSDVHGETEPGHNTPEELPAKRRRKPTYKMV